MISVLFTQKNSNYLNFNLDCWDEERDATNFNSTNVVITHPPCASWGRLRGLAKPKPGQHDLTFFAVDVVRKNGGILEHPRDSLIFKSLLPKPGLIDEFGGFTVNIDQHWFGHKAKKNTNIYICGINPADLPAYPLRFEPVIFTISSSNKKNKSFKKEVSKRDRSATPIDLIKWLIEIAELIEKKKNTTNYI